MSKGQVESVGAAENRGRNQGVEAFGDFKIQKKCESQGITPASVGKEAVCEEQSGRGP